MTLRIRIIGAGRAGGSFARALQQVGVESEVVARDGIETVGEGADGVLIATPDAAIAEVAAAIRPSDAVVMHCSGATDLGALSTHTDAGSPVGSLHPLMALPDPSVGAERLLGGGWFAVAGHRLAARLADLMGGRSFEVDDDARALYHATAAVSANHLVALLAQVERLAARVGVPVEAFLELAQGSFDDVAAHGARAALTGPAARGDIETLDKHRGALGDDEVDLYNALSAAATNLATS